TRTINFVDEAGNVVAPAETQTNDYSRTATIDYSNLDANGQPTITYGDWTLESENFSAVPAAQVSGMVPDRTSVIADNEAPTVAS
ncbi:mucin-binding protein, partial [Paucilactobacillus suebicus]